MRSIGPRYIGDYLDPGLVAIFEVGSSLALRKWSSIVLGLVLVAQFPAGWAQTPDPVRHDVAESRETKAAFSRLDALLRRLKKMVEGEPGRAPIQESSPDPPLPGSTSLAASMNGKPSSAPTLSATPGETGSLVEEKPRPPTGQESSPDPSLSGPTPPAAPMNGKPSPSQIPSATPGEAGSCGTLKEIEDRMEEVKERYEEYSLAINKANDKLPDFRKEILDPERVCARRTRDEIGSAIVWVRKIDILDDQKIVNTFAICIDGLRRETERNMDEADTTVRLQRLAARMEQLQAINDESMDVERALLRGISKRKRLLQELEQFHEEVTDACP